MRPPAFWNTEEERGSGALTRALLSPLGAIYAFATARRIARVKPQRAAMPVICVGNLTLGGTGKTPVAISLLRLLSEAGRTPFALTRGWKGELAGPVRVSEAHTARQVGDEPLLLARSAPVIVSRDRPAGAALGLQQGADVIVMDDGHQNPTLHKDLSLIVVDGETGWGANRVFPAGPLREPVRAGLARTDAVIVMTAGPDDAPDYRRLKLDGLEIPIFHAWLEPAGLAPSGKLLAFAGIGRPQKFFDALTAAGGELAEAFSFPDHHPYSDRDIARLLDLAEAYQAQPITTEKDWVRLPAEARAKVLSWPVQAVFAEPARIAALLEEVCAPRENVDASNRAR
ncbi:MAG: tetraacyldisaccharide 4'-kinase [Pseudomonadota bacterium]